MASTYTSELRIEKIATGEQSGTWGTTTNTQYDLWESTISGTVTVAFASDGDDTLTTNSGADDEARHMFIDLTGGSTLTATRNMVVPTSSKLYFVSNQTTGSQSVVIKTTAGTGITVPNGAYMALYCDGTNVVDAFTHMSALTLATVLAVAQGGSGLTSYTAGDFLYATGTTTLAKLAKGTANQVIAMNSGATAPEWVDPSDGVAMAIALG
ncbi:MAG: hypothetical protein HOE83_08430 [Alphaproteobacteria bacterium]|jgi:hypothetical protein|nr:hypothetical protein [Alphaproteobacteria bacterium]